MDAVVLYPGIGTSQDAPDENGSLHAKIAELRAYVNSQVVAKVVQKPRSTQLHGSFSTTSAGYVTALSVSGAGELLGIGADYAGGSTRYAYVKVTIDDLVVFTGRRLGGFPSIIGYPSKEAAIRGGGELSDGGDPSNLRLPFKSSLLIQIYVENAQSGTVYWVYCKE